MACNRACHREELNNTKADTDLKHDDRNDM